MTDTLSTLSLPEREALHQAEEAARVANNDTRVVGGIVARTIVAALVELDELRQRVATDPGPVPPAPDPAPMAELRRRLAIALDGLTDDVVHPPRGDGELAFAAAHATAAAALAYTRLGGDLELGPPPGPLEAELRVATLEDAIDRVLGAALELRVTGHLAEGRLEPLGDALLNLDQARAR